MIFFLFQVAGVAATTEQSSAPSVPHQGSSTLQLTDESHMSIATENAGYVLFYILVLYYFTYFEKTLKIQFWRGWI